jgi:hypothetical protein
MIIVWFYRKNILKKGLHIMKYTHRQADNGIQWYVEEHVLTKESEKIYHIAKVFYSEKACKLYITAMNSK